MDATGSNSKEIGMIYKHDPQLDLKLKGFLTTAINACPKFFKMEDLKLLLDGKTKEDLSKVGLYLRLLRKHGYAKKFYYRNSLTKRTVGVIWTLTEEKNKFPDDMAVTQILEDDLELMNPPRNGTYHEAMKNTKKKSIKSSDQLPKESLIETGKSLIEAGKNLIEVGKNLIETGKSLIEVRESLIAKNQQSEKSLIGVGESLIEVRESLIKENQQNQQNQQLGNANDQKTQRYSTLTTPDEAGAGFGESQNCELEHGSIIDTPILYIINNTEHNIRNTKDFDNNNKGNTKYFPCPDPPPSSPSGGNGKTGSIKSPKSESSNPKEEKFEGKKSSTDDPPSKSSGESKPRKKRQVKIPPLWMSEYDIQDFWNEPITPTMFETFRKFYPKIDCLGKARMAWSKICKKPRDKRPTLGQILGAIEAQKKSERWQEPRFIPDAGNWLLQERWNDDPSKLVLFKKRQETENPPTKNSTTKPKPDYSWLDNVKSIELDSRSLGWDGKIRGEFGVNPNLRFYGWEPGFRDWW